MSKFLVSIQMCAFDGEQNEIIKVFAANKFLTDREIFKKFNNILLVISEYFEIDNSLSDSELEDILETYIATQPQTDYLTKTYVISVKEIKEEQVIQYQKIIDAYEKVFIDYYNL